MNAVGIDVSKGYSTICAYGKLAFMESHFYKTS